MPRSALVLGLALLVVGIGGSLVPFLTEERETLAGTPIPPPLGGREEVVPIEPGSRICLDSVAIGDNARAARILVGTYFRAGQPLTLHLEGTDYRERTRVPGGYEDNTAVDFPITPPDAERLVTACVRNVGKRKVALYATSAKNESARPSVTLDGDPIGHEPGFVLLAASRTAVIERFPDAMRRAALFRPVPPLLVWLLAVLTVGGVLAAPLAALWLSAREQGTRGGDPQRSPD